MAAYRSAVATDLPIAVARFILRAPRSNCGQDWVKHLLPKLEHDRA
jgi:hypothetical protein